MGEGFLTALPLHPHFTMTGLPRDTLEALAVPVHCSLSPALRQESAFTLAIVPHSPFLTVTGCHISACATGLMCVCWTGNLSYHPQSWIKFDGLTDTESFFLVSRC